MTSKCMQTFYSQMQVCWAACISITCWMWFLYSRISLFLFDYVAMNAMFWFSKNNLTPFDLISFWLRNCRLWVVFKSRKPYFNTFCSWNINKCVNFKLLYFKIFLSPIWWQFGDTLDDISVVRRKNGLKKTRQQILRIHLKISDFLVLQQKQTNAVY